MLLWCHVRLTFSFPPLSQVLLLDEISTGLDSSTTYQIIKYLRDTTHHLKYTTLIALLQPAPETYDLFDDVLLISDGAYWKLTSHHLTCQIRIDTESIPWHRCSWL